MIQYERIDNRTINVKVDGIVSGQIKEKTYAKMPAFQYFPKGSSEGGKIYNTLLEVKKSLEEE